MKMDFDYLNYLTSTKLKKVSGKNVNPVSHLIWKISFLMLFGCAVKITLDINPIHIWLDGQALSMTKLKKLDVTIMSSMQVS